MITALGLGQKISLTGDTNMRSIIASILWLLSATISQAAIQPDALRDLAYTGDFQSVDTAMAQAHQQSLTGEISYDDLRDLLGVLVRTHPDMADFRLVWLENMPESPYAQMANAWALYNTSFAIRGAASARDTPRPALRLFTRMQREAMQLALSAYDVAPDFVPASDGVIRMQLTTKMLWGWMIQGVITDTMTTTPNFGTLTRASSLSDRRWGGAGPEFNLDLCNTYFDKIPEYPDLTEDACIVSLLTENDQLEGNRSFIADVLDREDHDVLIPARVKRALERRTDADHQIVMDYLSTVSFDHPWIRNDFRIARRFARDLRPIENPQIDAFLDALQIRLRAELIKELEHNPFYPHLLEIAMRGQLLSWTYIPAAPLEAHNYSLRVAVVQPYHIENWSNAKDPYADAGNPSLLNRLDTTRYNAVAYSDHNIFMIANFLQIKLDQYRRFRDPAGTSGFWGWPEPPQDELISEIGCRVATLIRLFDDAAEQNPEHLNFVEGFRVNQSLNETVVDLKTFDACNYVWDATIDELKFTPIEIDRRSLLVIPESSPFAPSVESFTQDTVAQNP